MSIGLCALLASLSAWHAVRQVPSDVRSYHEWILGPLPSWTVPGPYPVGADLLWWPLRAVHGININPIWLLGWTGPATVLACVLLWRTASQPTLAVCAWLLAAALLERAYWTRLEPVAALFTVVAVVAARRRHPAVSAVSLSVGTLIKVWPAFLFPIILPWLRESRARVRWLAWFTAPWVVYSAALAMARPPGGTTWVTFTLTRRIQLESFTALPALWAMASGSRTWRTFYAPGLDSADLMIGPYLHAGHLALEGIGLAALTILALRTRKWWRIGGAPNSCAAGLVLGYAQTTTLLILIICGPVLSPQYLIWFAPVLVVAVGEGEMLLESVIWLADCALTTLEFPYFADAIRATQPAALAVLSLRDLVLVALLTRCVRRLWQLTR